MYVSLVADIVLGDDYRAVSRPSRLDLSVVTICLRHFREQCLSLGVFLHSL